MRKARKTKFTVIPDENPILDFYESLDRANRFIFSHLICGICEIGRMQFYRRIRENLWTRLERKAIAELMAQTTWTLNNPMPCV